MGYGVWGEVYGVGYGIWGVRYEFRTVSEMDLVLFIITQTLYGTETVTTIHALIHAFVRCSIIGFYSLEKGRMSARQEPNCWCKCPGCKDGCPDTSQHTHTHLGANKFEIHSGPTLDLIDRQNVPQPMGLKQNLKQMPKKI